MMKRINLTFSTFTSTQLAKKPRKATNIDIRHLRARPQRKIAGKERDSETGLYYYGARYLDPKASRWLSGDPAVGEYVPSAPVSDEARKRNGNLPGMGGVFNYVNLHVYHYGGNNPVKYVDLDGREKRPLVQGIIMKMGETENGKNALKDLNAVFNYATQVSSNNVDMSIFIGLSRVTGFWMVD